MSEFILKMDKWDRVANSYIIREHQIKAVGDVPV